MYIPYTSNNPLYTDALTTLTTFYDKLCNPNNINKTNELTISILYPSEGAGSENKGQGSENLRMEYPINSLRNLALQNVSEYSEYVCEQPPFSLSLSLFLSFCVCGVCV